MNTTRLGELADLRAGFGFPKKYQGRSTGELPFAKVGDISRVGRSDKNVLTTAGHFIDEVDLKDLKARTVPAGSTLFAKIGEAIRQEHRVMAGCSLVIDNNAMAAVPKPGVDPRYLFRFLQTVKLYALTSSTTVPSIRKSDLELIQVPRKNIAEQRRIAAILDKADELRAKRRKSLALLDILSKSIFDAMFGPNTIRMGWTSAELGSAASFFGGNSLPDGLEYSGQEGGFALLKVSDMNREGNEVRLHSSKLWSECGGSKAATCPANTIVIPKRGAAIATNKKRITTRPSVLDPNLMGIAPGPALNIEYLHAWFNAFDLGTITSGSSVPQLNKKDLAPLLIEIPPMDLQDAFASRVREIDRLKHSNKVQLAELEVLFATLQHRAFTEGL